MKYKWKTEQNDYSVLDIPFNDEVFVQKQGSQFVWSMGIKCGRCDTLEEAQQKTEAALVDHVNKEIRYTKEAIDNGISEEEIDRLRGRLHQLKNLQWELSPAYYE